MQKLTEIHKIIVMSMAKNNMNVTDVATELIYCRNTIVYHIEQIKKKYGLDPKNFYDLCRLVEMANDNKAEDSYKQLGFEYSDILENPYGIKIYIGTKGEDDWCVEIPKELFKAKCSNYKLNQNFMIYLVSEEHALEKAREFTELAKRVSVHNARRTRGGDKNETLD